MQLLAESDIRFRQVIPDLEEAIQPGEQPYVYARRLAEDKALAVAAKVGDDSLVIGCDTIVVLDELVLEKPKDEADARRILSLLSGHKHVVCSALAIAQGRNVLASGYDLTNVYFNTLSTEAIARYIASGEPMDKAGAYGIQGMGAFLVDRIEGNLDTVVGLPRMLLEDLAGKVLACI
jgi:septum formation protein